VIDLHSHTTASDGWCTPQELIRRARDAGVRTLGVTDHDTMAGVPAARAAGARLGIAVVAGIEITAVDRQHDVHMLGYFVDPSHPALAMFLERQRADRVRRVREMAHRLAVLGYPVDVELALRTAAREGGRAVGRPLLARALVESGHAADTRDAFGRLLGRGCAAYVPRCGATPAEVVALIREAGGVASIAHPGKTQRDDLVPALADAGLDALEVHHPDHTAADRARYLAAARQFGLAVTGGSDYHGNPDHGGDALGAATTSEKEFARLMERRR
jgi:predicted metal-dependent phosphoesterase TrpH